MILAALLLASTLHAGPERAVSAAVRDAQPYYAYAVAFAAGEDSALLVWQEASLLRAARIDRDGKTLDEVPLLLAYSTEPPEAYVARGTDGWLVVWYEPRRIVAKRVADDGSVGEPVVIAEEAGVPRVAFDGSGYLAAWRDGCCRLFAARLSAGGQLLESGIAIAPGQDWSLVELLPADGGGFELVAVTLDDITALRLDRQGRVQSKRLLTTASHLQGLTAEREPDGGIALSWFNEAGTHVKSESAPMATFPYAHGGADDLVSAGGATYAILRDEGFRVSLVRLAANTIHELPLTATGTRAASFGDRWLLAASGPELTVTVLDATPAIVAASRPVIREPRVQSDAKVAQAGNARLVVWTESAGNQATVMGKLDDGDPFAVADGLTVAVATDGRDFLVLWQEALSLHVRRVQRDGTLGPQADLPGWAQQRACVAWSGSDYVIGSVPMLLPPNRIGLTQALAWRVSAGGVPLGQPVPISPSLPLTGIACASTATTTLFVWDDTRADVGGATLSHGGTISGAFPIGKGLEASVAAHGDGFLAGWFGGGVVHYATVSEGGTVGLPHTIEADAVTVASRRAGYLLLLYGRGPLRARTLDARGNAAGEETILGIGSRPAFAGDTLVYQRDLDVLPHPRWRVFLRSLTFPAKRRAL